MKTKVGGLLIKDDLGIPRRVSSRCVNGDFKRKYIRKLIEDGILQPTAGTVTLLGELIDENVRLRSQLNAAVHEKEMATDVIDSITERVHDYYYEVDTHH